MSARDFNLPQNISSSLNREYDPSLSPDGRYIAYCAESDGDENIWLLDLESRRKRQITFHSASDYSPEFWGNSKILFVSRRDNSLGEIFITDVNGKKQETIIGGGGYYDSPAAARDGSRIAYVYSDLNDSVFIYIYDVKRDEKRKGPRGLDPSFFPSGDSLIFVSPVDERGANKLAVYSLIDSSIIFFDTGGGLHLNPVILGGGDRILFEKKSRDTSEDGRVTISDDSDLMILNLSDMRLRRLLPGLEFSNPDASKNNLIAAQGDDGNIYLIPPGGLTEKEPDGESQYALCDSLVTQSLTFNDSLIGGIACYEAYNYYPENCRELITRSALIYAGLNYRGLALDILADPGYYADSLFEYEIRLTEAKIRYGISSKKEYMREKYKAIDICKTLLGDERLPDNLKKETYKFCISLYFNEKMYDDGKRLIDDGISEFNNDADILAVLERWDLKYLASTYAGDINDLIPIYIELIEKYELNTEINEILVNDLIALLIDAASGNVLDELEELRSNYESYPLLSGSASLEQAKILSLQGRKSLAQWRLEEISERYFDNPRLRFAVFNELFDLYMDGNIYDKAGVMIDSASAYLDFIDNYKTVESFKIKAAGYYAFSGYEKLKNSSDEARKLFVEALTCNANNYNAIWGLAAAGYSIKNNKSLNDIVFHTLSGAGIAYLKALTNIVNFENNNKISDLKKARAQLSRIIEKYPSFPLSYLSISYADCLLEENSKEPQGLYEEAVESSFKGISLINKNEDLAYGFYLNLGEAYFGLTQYNEAFKYYKAAKEINIALENNLKFIKKYGESALYIDSIETAKEYFERLYEKSSDSGDAETRAFAALKLGLLNQLQGKYIEAAELYEAAKRYYNARNDGKTLMDLLKAQAFCLKMTGDDKSASVYAGEALTSSEKIKYKEIKYDNRVKFILWPFGINIPLIELLPMRFGGSLYPKGFTRAADEAFLLEMAHEGRDIISGISLKNRQIEILENSDEEANSVDLWDNVGAKYLEIGYFDSSMVSYKKAYKLCMNLEDYHGAYIELLNWAEAVFYCYPGSDYPAVIKQMDEIEDKALDLYDYILPSYPNARANLKNIAGLAQYIRGLIESGNVLNDEYSDVRGFLAGLNSGADRIHERFSRAVYYFRDALAELVPGEYPDIETGLSLNIAVASYSLGDFEGLRSSIKSAKKSAVFSTSASLYARLLALDAIISRDDDDSFIESLRDAVGLYENMPIGKSQVIDTPLLETVYTRIIEYYINEGDIYSGLFYLESMKNLLLAARLNQINAVKYKSDRFRANFNLLRQYQKNLIDLYMEKKKLEAIGVTGKIRLREVTENILRIRGRILELRQETKELDPVAYSSLVFDPPSVISLIEDIPDDEIYIVTFKISNEIALWICKNDSLDLSLLNDPDDFNNFESIEDLAGFNIVTIISSNDIYERLRDIILRKSPEIIIKRAYSLNDAHKTGISGIRQVTGIAILRFDGFVLTDGMADEIGADIINYDSTSYEIDLSKYGWIILDGKLVVDDKNFIFSSWERFGGDGDNIRSDKFAIRNLPKIKNNAFGAILIDPANEPDESENAILIKLIENMGVNAVLRIENILDPAALESDIKKFFDGLEAGTPIRSYYGAFIQGSIVNNDNNSYIISYFGDDGWSKNEEDLHVKDLFNEYVLIGNQFYILKNWAMAEKYYSLALNIVSNRKFDSKMKAHAAGNLMKTYEKTGEYNYRIQRDHGKLIEIFEKTGDSLQLAKIYYDMAEIKYDINELENSIDYATMLIEITEKTKDFLMRAKGFAIRGKALKEKGELDKAQADLSKSLELFPANNIEDKLWSGLYLAEIFNLMEMYGKSKMRLDSLEVLIDKDRENNIYREYLIQLSRYHIGTFRNESARRNLESLLKENKNNAEAAVLLGKIYLMRGDFESALESAEKGLSLLKGRGKSLIVMETYELLGDIYRAMGRKEKSLIDYRLAEDAIGNYEYRKSSDLLRYKRELVSENGSNDMDSLYNAIISDSKTEYVKNLCRYQLGYHAVIKDNKKKAGNYFMEISKSIDKNTLGYLKWRAFYNLALIAEKEIKLNHLESAERLIREYPVEPDYVKAAHGLWEDRSDLYNMAAEIRISEERASPAVNYLETGYSQKISGRHFSVGNFDSTENIILNHIFMNEKERDYIEYTDNEFKSMENNLAYGVLWGVRPDSVEELQGNLNDDEAVLRFYSADNGFMAAYVDKDSIFIHKYGFKEDELSKSLMMMDDLLADQQKADSIMEKWYSEIISPVERFLDEKDRILVIPDGILFAFPFETLKMPDGDYLSEMFILIRHIYLPREFPKDPLEGTSVFLEFEAGYDPDVRLIQYIAEPLLKPAGPSGNRVRFYSGDFSFFDGSHEGERNIACTVKPFSEDNYLNLALQAVMSARDGNVGFIYPLWDLSNEIKAAFYWRFLRNLADGKGYWNSYRISRSYIFGHYDGLPNLWGANVFMSLN
ncbi:MAG: PD40 domain-containing protein [Candidatus Zixiibacteriota bacterium]|nr:MAG: PD40 domain-containing protein [candidate division Zixibacteria bacterium]